MKYCTYAEVTCILVWWVNQEYAKGIDNRHVHLCKQALNENHILLRNCEKCNKLPRSWQSFLASHGDI
jgi:hypothetical protein